MQILKECVVPQRSDPPVSRLFLKRQTLRHYKGKNQALELWVQRPDPVSCHHLSYIKVNTAGAARD
jgi:hypothetical protein